MSRRPRDLLNRRGNNGLESVAKGFESGENGFESVANEFESGENGFESVAKGFERGQDSRQWRRIHSDYGSPSTESD